MEKLDGVERIREIIRVLMESSLYLELPLKERLKLIRRLYDNASLFGWMKA